MRYLAGHVVPEAINGGPIALVKDGDKIVIDSVNREINWLVDEEEQARRRKEWEASGQDQIRERRGILYKYARDVAVSPVSLRVVIGTVADVPFVCAACEPRCIHRLNQKSSITIRTSMTHVYKIIMKVYQCN